MIEFVIVISRVFSPTTPTSIWNKCLLHKNRVLKSKRQCNHDSIEDKWFYIICAGKFLYEINWCRHSTLLSFFRSFYFFFLILVSVVLSSSSSTVSIPFEQFSYLTWNTTTLHIPKYQVENALYVYSSIFH